MAIIQPWEVAGHKDCRRYKKDPPAGTEAMPQTVNCVLQVWGLDPLPTPITDFCMKKPELGRWTGRRFLAR